MMKNYSIKYRDIVNNYKDGRIGRKPLKQMLFTKNSKLF